MRCNLSKNWKTILTLGLVLGFGTFCQSASAREIEDAYVQEAACGPHVTGMPNLDNGIGDVLLAYRDGDQLVYERHLIANPELCRKVPYFLSLSRDGLTPFIVSKAADSTLFGKIAIMKATLSDQGLVSVYQGETTKPGDGLYQDLFKGISDTTQLTFVRAEKSASRPSDSKSGAEIE